MEFRKIRTVNAMKGAAFISAMFVLCAGCGTRSVGTVGDGGTSDNSSSVTSAGNENSAAETTSSETATTEFVTEPPAEDKRVHVIAAGDNLIHYSVFKNAEKLAGAGENYDFKPLYEPVKYLIEGADVAILNQETIISESNPVRGADGGALLFNSPPEAADAVIDLGFDVFTMANNHLLDFGASALEESINFWNEKAETYDLTILGAYLDEDDSENIRVREVNGVKIAFLAYAEHINGFSIPSDSSLRVVMNYEEDVIERQIKKADEIADAVIVSAHWGVEDTHLVSEDRIELADKMVNWGADVILGCHTHTAESMEWIERDDGTKGFVYYSMGNFICCQTDNFNLVGEMPDFDIVVDGATGETRLEDVGCIPNIIHYEANSYSNLSVYPYSKYTPELAAAHGVPYAYPAGTYTSFGWDIVNDIIDENIPKEFQKLDK